MGFDPDAFQIVLFDQRGCGDSEPYAADPATDMAHNTTEHLLADMEALREHLGIDRWLLYGGSWASTLILAYAQRHPRRVIGIILVGVTMTRPCEIDWLYHGLRLLLPIEWERFRAEVPAADRDGNLIQAYRRLMEDPDIAVRSGPRTSGVRGKTRRSLTRPSAAPVSTVPSLTRPSRRLCGYVRITSPMGRGWKMSNCCEMPTGSRASPGSWYTDVSTFPICCLQHGSLHRPGRTPT
jgi:pimeloyl-ACP methyl ester carboxylesterase